jgi:hypothetical protein
MILPVLTAYDPVLLSEGSIDPLGLYSIADRLGIRLAPGIRERQTHPLFLTAIAACAHICSEFDDDLISSDGISRPWQICEWYVVEGIVRCARSDSDLVGLPGRNKVQTAIDSRSAISAARYLKTPSVFGFHGVYRLLARTLDVIDNDGRLGANGYELLVVWEQEEQMPGFITGTRGEGKTFLGRMREAVRLGIESGRTNRSNGWSGWSQLYQTLRHTRMPESESRLIAQWLMNGDSSELTEIYKHLLSPRNIRRWLESKGNERAFHDYVRSRCSNQMGALIDAIIAYERFCTSINNAFFSALVSLSDRQIGVALSDIADSHQVIDAAENAAIYFHEAVEALDVFLLGSEFERAFAAFGEHLAPVTWLEMLVRHHEHIQKAKPPAGKMPWVERFGDGKIYIRPPYKQDSDLKFPDADSYLHAYRTNSLWSFASDLGLLEDNR